MMAVLAAVVLVGALALGLAGCGDAESGDPSTPPRGPETLTYTGYSGTVKYTLKITEKTAKYAAQAGDNYELTRSNDAKKSTGTVSGIGATFTLQPSASGASTFTVTVAGANINAMSGTIAWDGGGTDTAPTTLTAAPDNGGGGDQPGINIAAKYRETYSEHASEWIGPSSNDDAIITNLVVGENTISWYGGTNGSFTDVSTGSDKDITPSIIGTWAYLYSGNDKIGLIIAFSEFGGGGKIVTTGKRYVQAFAMTAGQGLGITGSDVYSDIADEVRNISGEYDPEGEGDPDDPDPVGGDPALINAEGEAWINVSFGITFTGYIFYANGDLRVIGGLVSDSDYNIATNELRSTEWYVSDGKLYGGGGEFVGDDYTVEGNNLIKYPGTAYSQIYVKTAISGLSGGSGSSIFETGPGEVWVDSTSARAYLFIDGKVYIVYENGVNNWTAPFLMESLTYTGNTLTNSGGAGETYTLSVTGETLTWKNNLNGETSTFTKKTGQTIAGEG